MKRSAEVGLLLVALAGAVLLAGALRRRRDEGAGPAVVPSPTVSGTERPRKVGDPGPIRQDPRETPEALYNRAVDRTARQDYRGALADYDLLLERGWETPEAYFNRALVKTALADDTGALRDYDRALELRRDWPEALVNRAQGRERRGEFGEARRDLERALQLAPASWPYRAHALAAMERLKSR
jgi:tetratricopeptide (TPR) repeat protein